MIPSSFSSFILWIEFKAKRFYDIGVCWAETEQNSSKKLIAKIPFNIRISKILVLFAFSDNFLTSEL